MTAERFHPRRRDDERDRLLAALVLGAGQVGFGALDPLRIAQLAELPEPSFHRLFADPADCLAALYEEASARVGGAVARAAQDHAEWPVAVAATTAAVLHLAARDLALTSLCALDLGFIDAPARARRQEDVRRLAGLLRRGREHCPHGDRMPDLLEQANVAGAIFVVGLEARRGRLDPAGLAPEITHFLLVPYLGRAEALRLAGSSPSARDR
jgi:AcrR family transcriptional regulator